MDGTSLSPTDCTAVVEDPHFEQWESHLAAGDYKQAAAISSPQTLGITDHRVVALTLRLSARDEIP